MENAIVDILKRLARADAATKELTAQVEAQSLLLAALMLTVGKGSSSVMATNIEKAILSAASASEEILRSDAELLMTHFVRLITVSQFIEANGDEANSKEEATAKDESTANDGAYADVEETATIEATANDKTISSGGAYADVEETANIEAAMNDKTIASGGAYADVEETANIEAAMNDKTIASGGAYADVEETANNEVNGDDEANANNEVTTPTNNK
jgi:hypothetical protein